MLKRTGWLPRLAMVLTACLFLPAAAQASPLFELAGGVHGQGGFNARATGAGSASTYFNPALLPKAPGGVDVSFMVLHDRIDIDLAPRCPNMDPCPYDVLDRFNEIRTAPPEELLPPVDAVPTSWLQDGFRDFQGRPRQQQRDARNVTAYAVVGLTVPIFDQWLVFGFYGMVPMGDFTRASSFFVDEREQLFTNSLHAELYEDRLQATSLAFAFGSQLHEQLSVGVAATLALTNDAFAPVFVPDSANLSDIRLLSDVNVRVGIAPHLAVHYEPHEDVHLSFTAHSPSELEIIAAYEFTLRDGSTQSSGVKFTHAYMPWKLALGGAWDVLESNLQDVTLAATVEYTFWSKYKDRTPEPVGAEAILFDDVPDWPTAGYEWNDTISGVLGVRWRYRDVHLFADGIFQPTPVPDQTGRTNYVDNHRVGGMLGAEAEFVLADTTFRVGGHFQVHRLIPRSVTKTIPETNDGAGNAVDVPDDQVQDAVPDDAVFSGGGQPDLADREGLQTNNPGFPGYSSDGWILGGGVNLSVLF